MWKPVRIILLVAGVAVAAGGIWILRRQPPRAPAPTVPATTQSAPAPPATLPAAPKPPRTYIDVVLRAHPGFPTTQPLPIPLNLAESARLVFDDPIYLDPIGQLWITRTDAEPTSSVLKSATTQPTHVIRERVAFVHRWPDVRGIWQPYLVVADGETGGYALVQAGGRQPLGSAHRYDWSRAFSWNDVIVVPTETGVSIIRPDRRPLELHHEFKLGAKGPKSPPQMLLDWRGLIAWMPWEPGRNGSNGAMRFVNDAWIDLDKSRGWPQRLLQLVPLLDGSVIQIHVDQDGDAALSLALLDPPAVDEAAISMLVEQLSDPDPAQREAAFSELTRYGPGAWPVLEKLAPNQPPEGMRRVELLLGAKQQPTLGGMTLLPGEVRVIARSTGGAAMLLAESGVSIPAADDEPRIVAPAWLMLLPGRPIQLASDDLTRDFIPGKSEMTIIGRDIFVSDEAQGPRLWLSNHFSQPLLKKAHLAFARQIVGVDGRGRWLFRRHNGQAAQTLVIDPTLPDPTPRLPVWNYPVAGGTAGWTKEGWPAIKRGGAWVLTEKGWSVLDETKSPLLLEVAADAQTTSAAATQAEPAILRDADGTKYFGGKDSIRIVRPDGSEITWPLPPQAIGTSETVWLLRAGEDRLFLFNAPGRILRLRPTPHSPSPFELEATFTRRIPSSDNVLRAWVDPAGRMNMIVDADHLLIMFPAGHIPREIAEMMPAEELRAAESEE